MDPAEARRRSATICERIRSLEEFRRAAVVMVYLPIRLEVDTEPLIRAAWDAGKTVLAPKVNWRRRRLAPVEFHSLDEGLVPGRYGIREPVGGEAFPPESIDLVIVPAFAYDRRGNRLGKGGGFYDRFLASDALRATSCGAGFDEQLLDTLPINSQDIPVDLLVTDTELLRFTDDDAQERTP